MFNLIKLNELEYLYKTESQELFLQLEDMADFFEDIGVELLEIEYALEDMNDKHTQVAVFGVNNMFVLSKHADWADKYSTLLH